jgi:hypothetical protein
VATFPENAVARDPNVSPPSTYDLPMKRSIGANSKRLFGRPE